LFTQPNIHGRFYIKGRKSYDSLFTTSFISSC
jgi:hypothetical protein